MKKVPIFISLLLYVFILGILENCTCSLFGKEPGRPKELESAVVADWKRQEERLGRSFDSPEALEELLQRTRPLLQCMTEKQLISSGDAKRLKSQIDAISARDLEKMTPEDVEREYVALRWNVRDVIFQNPLLKEVPIVFLKGDRYIWQLIHEYLSFYHRFTNTTNDGFFLLKNPGRSFETTALTSGNFPSGSFATPSLSYDAKTLYFAFADFSKVVPEGTPRTTERELIPDFHEYLFEYLAEPEGKYHLFQMDLASGKVEQLTEGPNDDFDPVLLPDGDLVFVSTRCGGLARCTGRYEPVQTATLHKRFHQDGSIECLSWHETNEWNPAVLSDGRIVFSRWDYVDREAARYMNLWIMNPDGTGTQALFGNYTEKVVASLQPEEIPGSNKILFLGSGHHLAVGGPLVILDPTKVRYNTETGEDSLDCLDVISPEIPFPETPAAEDPVKKHYVSDHYYYSPYPLSEDFYLTSFSHDPNGGYLSIYGYNSYTGTCGEPYSAGKMGLYYRDRFGNLELIYEDPQTSCRYPIQLKERPVPKTIASKRVENEPNYGTFLLSNVYESLIPLPKDRPIKEIRVFQIFPKFPEYVMDRPKTGHALASNTRMYLGSVPVEPDGSAHFRVPARKPLYFQAVDAEGKAVRTMLSEVYLQPGEHRGCVGCHEQAQTTQKNFAAGSSALRRAPSELQPGPRGTKPFSYTILIQPILDRSCIACHNGEEDSPEPALTGEPLGNFTVSYNRLAPYLRWYGWGETIHRITSIPGRCGCDESPLTQILEDSNHGSRISLTEADRRTLYFWMDANVPFFGTEAPDDMERQLRGEEVPIPERNTYTSPLPCSED